MLRFSIYTFFFILLICSVNILKAEEGKEKPISLGWSFNGVLGKFDKNSINRGYIVYKEVCSSCHSLNRISFRNLKEIGMPEDFVKAIASSYEFDDAIDDSGEVQSRKGEIYDYFPSPYKNKQAAAAANNGAVPPDLSLIIKARHNGANYLYSLLTGYTTTDPNEEGLYENPYFEGGALSMAPPLIEGIVTYPDMTEASISTMAYDVVNFLQWAAEPEMESRKKLGLKIMVFLLILSVLLYKVNKSVWRDIKD
ncbi:cytochrome c1 [Anaplasmataceae bacterium AB001_6]|nr:cytochrome c1 [Anaplasmataceae bacterium AB001_6]